MGEFDFTYRLPQNFSRRVVQYLEQLESPNVARAFQNCTYDYEDLGLAYYAGMKGDNWDKKALDFTVEGSPRDIALLKSKGHILKESISKSLKSSESGFLLKEIYYFESESVEPIPLSNAARLNADIASSQVVLRDLLQIGQRFCLNCSFNGASSENSMNDYFRDLLFMKGYTEIKDQTRHGLSVNKKDSAEVDILLTKDGKEIAIYEGLKLSSVSTTYIDTHISKAVVNYNALGTSTFIVAYAFIIATHTDREHIHNHIIYNSTALDSTRKFRDFLLSGLAVQRLSDLICLEHQLSVIEIKPYRERQKRTLYPPRESNRDKLCAVIDNILLSEKPASFEGFLQKLEQRGYEIKRGKYTSVKGTRQKRFIRFRTLGAGYSEDEIKAVIAGDAEHCPHQKQPPKEQPFHLLVDIQAKLSEGKSEGYARWAKKYNLKEMSKTLIFLQEKKIGSIKEMQERVDAATARYHELGDSIKVAETRMAEIAVLRTHIVNYAKTRPVYDAYRKAGYSKRFLENHRAEITLHKAAKAAFDESNLKTLPKVKELDAEYSKLLTEKKALYPDYRKAKDEMQELLRAQRNVELFFAEEKNTTEKTQSR